MTAWEPNRYLQFSAERTRPAIDLASRIAIDDPETVIDLGCGPGNSTQVLRQRWPGARICGLDHSREMIAAARQSYPAQEWILSDIKGWSADVLYTVVFSNAVLQWLPDHAALIGHLFAQVAAGGALAFQVPSGAHSPLRAAIHEISQDAAWNSRMEKARQALTWPDPYLYYDVLAPRAKSVDAWETEYYHVLASPSAIVEWASGTGLRPFLSALDSKKEKQRFTALLTARLAEAYPIRSDGRVLFPFKRTFVIAYA